MKGQIVYINAALWKLELNHCSVPFTDWEKSIISSFPAFAIISWLIILGFIKRWL